MESTNIVLEKIETSVERKTPMRKITLSSLLLLLVGLGLMVEKTLTTPVPDPLVMFLSGTALIAISRILRKVTVER
jgi:hypothetical protein